MQNEDSLSGIDQANIKEELLPEQPSSTAMNF
jgi:hypothetical protein